MTSKKVLKVPDYTVVHEKKSFIVHRDDKPLKTPAEAVFHLPTKALAEAVASEWRGQVEKIDFAAMPLTQLAATALDIVAKDRDASVNRLLAYTTSELLCHRAEKPKALAERQEEIWQPYLNWCASKYDALFQVSYGVMPGSQTAEVVRSLHGALKDYDDFTLTGLSSAVDTTGSLVLGLALAEGFQNAENIFQAAELDTRFQSEAWGEDIVTQARHKTILHDLDVCERWFGLLG